MAQNPDDGFSVNDIATTSKMDEFKSAQQIPDELWVTRLAPIPVGASFTANRPEGETVRAFKKRINRAAMVHWKTLEWKSKDTNLPDGVEPTRFVAKVKALDLKAKAEAEARMAQTSHNGPETAQNGQETTNPPETGDEASVGPRGRRAS